MQVVQNSMEHPYSESKD